MKKKRKARKFFDFSLYEIRIFGTTIKGEIMKLNKNGSSETLAVLGIVAGIALFVGLVTLMMWGLPKYKVYSQELRGIADLRESEYNKQILVEEARAQEEALQMRARGEAERERIKADATSYAIEKIGVVLQENPAYLRWMWINEVAGGSGERIYIPTEAGMPILEAGALR